MINPINYEYCYYDVYHKINIVKYNITNKIWYLSRIKYDLNIFYYQCTFGFVVLYFFRKEIINFPIIFICMYMRKLNRVFYVSLCKGCTRFCTKCKRYFLSKPIIREKHLRTRAIESFRSITWRSIRCFPVRMFFAMIDNPSHAIKKFVTVTENFCYQETFVTGNYLLHAHTHRFGEKNISIRLFEVNSK